MKKIISFLLVIALVLGTSSVSFADETLVMYPNALTPEELIAEMEGWYYYLPEFEVNEERMLIYLARGTILYVAIENGLVDQKIVEHLWDNRGNHTYSVDGETFPIEWVEECQLILTPTEENGKAILSAEGSDVSRELLNTEELELWYYSDNYGYRVLVFELAQFIYDVERAAK